MKKAFSLAILFCALFLTVSCSSMGDTKLPAEPAAKAPAADEAQAAEKQAAQAEAPFEPIVRDEYTVVKEGGTLSLTFTKQQSASQSSEGAMLASVNFSSIDEYRDTLLNGTLSSQQLSALSAFNADKNSPIRLPDPDQLIPVALPEGWKLTPSLFVYPDHYTYVFEYADGYGFFSILYSSEGAWTAAEDQFNRFYVLDDVTPKAEEHQSLSCLTYYKTTDKASVKSMVFGLSDSAAEKQNLGMMFCLAHDSDQVTVSETVPQDAMMIGQTVNGTVYLINLYPHAEVSVETLKSLRPIDNK